MEFQNCTDEDLVVVICRVQAQMMTCLDFYTGCLGADGNLLVPMNGDI